MTIAAESLRPDQQILVQGVLSFARLTSQYTGDALQKRIQKQRELGARYPTSVPHTTISLVDAQVLPADPSTPTLEEQFVMQKIYTSGKGVHAGKSGFSLDEVGKYLPPVAVRTENGTYQRITLERELASGLQVLLVLRTFASPYHEKRGLGIAQILLQEPVKYYEGNATPDLLARRGIVLEGDAAPVPAEAAAATSATQGTSMPANSVIDPSTGFAAPSPSLPPVPMAAPIAPIPTAASAAPVAVPTATTPAAQQRSATDIQAEIHRLQQLQAQATATAVPAQTPQGVSPFDAAPAASATTAPTPQAQPDPWAPVPTA